jgi:hypothetical protein
VNETLDLNIKLKEDKVHARSRNDYCNIPLIKHCNLKAMLSKLVLNSPFQNLKKKAPEICKIL